MKTTITPEMLMSALQYVPANLPRDEWARVGMAVKSEYPDDTGRRLFTEWSATAESFDAKSTQSTWRIFKAGGGVSIGTLLHLAKENGFTLPKADQAASKPDPETVARLARERAERQQADQARQQAAHDRDTHARAGHNPSRDKATAAARSVRGIAVFPESLLEGGSDFNDLHEGSSLEAVRCIVEAAIDSHQAAQTAAHAAQANKTGKRAARTHGASPAGPIVATATPAAITTLSRLTMAACGLRVPTRTASASPLRMDLQPPGRTGPHPRPGRRRCVSCADGGTRETCARMH